MSVFEAGKTYRTRGGGEFYVNEIFKSRLYGRTRRSGDDVWVGSSRSLDGRMDLGEVCDLDLLPPEPPIPPVVVSADAYSAYYNEQSPRDGCKAVITAWLREHPNALAGYRRDCAEREGGE